MALALSPAELKRRQREYQEQLPKDGAAQHDGDPPPHPPSSFKQTYYSGMGSIDEIAMRVANSQSLNQKIPDLMKSLLSEFAGDKENKDLKTVRVIYRWLGAHNYTEIDMTKYDNPPKTAHDLLCLCKADNAHALVLDYMFKFCDLPRKIIYGKIKGGRYVAYDKNTIFDKVWNAVFIDNDWRFLTVEPNYISRHRDFGEIDERSFLTDPNEIIFTQMATEEEWQLLPTPVNFKQFKTMAKVEPRFFKYGLKFETEAKDLIISSDSQEVEIVLSSAQPKLDFQSELFLERELGREKQEVRRAIVASRPKQNHWSTKIRFMCEGKYRCRILCADEMELNRYVVCTVWIDCQVPTALEPLPLALPMQCFGFDYSEEVEAEQPNENGEISTDDGVTIIKFRISRSSLCFKYDLRHHACSDQLLKDYVNFSQSDKMAVFYCRAPFSSEAYVLAISVATNYTERYRPLCQYLITAKKCFIEGEFPANDGRIGPGENNMDGGKAKCTSHSDDMIFLDGDTVTLEYEIADNVVLDYTLFVNERNEGKRVLATRTPGRANFKFHFEDTGLYIFVVLGRERSRANRDDRMEELDRKAIDVRNSSFTQPAFPEQSQEWTGGDLTLVEPKEGDLEMERTYSLVIETRDREPQIEVETGSEDERVQLTNEGGNRWSAEFTTPNEVRNIKVFGRGQEVLKFKVVDDETRKEKMETVTEKNAQLEEKKQKYLGTNVSKEVEQRDFVVKQPPPPVEEEENLYAIPTPAEDLSLREVRETIWVFSRLSKKLPHTLPATKKKKVPTATLR